VIKSMKLAARTLRNCANKKGEHCFLRPTNIAAICQVQEVNN